MEKPECLLVRTGEIYLKSKQVQRRFVSILLNNIRTGLRDNKIKFRIELIPNRIYIYTKQIKKTIDVLKRIFGIVSISPVWICKSTMRDMKRLGKSIFKAGKKKFAIRARRSGSHKFTSQDIASKVGWIIEGGVDLSNPEKEFFVECRQKKTYMFTEKIPGPGGLPLGTAGRIIAYLNDKDSVIAAWMMMKRGCQIIAVYKNKKYVDVLKKWHTGKKLNYHRGRINDVTKKTHTYIICASEGGYCKLRRLKNTLILRPLIALDNKILENLSKTIFFNGSSK